MNRERLERLADLLEALPENGSAGENGMKFNLNTWMTCGTVACACGHAACDPWFKRQGLRLEYWQTGNDDGYGLFYRHWTHFTAVAQFFQISSDRARHLFSGSNYKRITRPRDVAERIRETLK